VYGYSLLNWLFYLPIQAIGLYMWINRQVFYDLVAPRKLSKLWLFVSIGALGATVFLTTVLNRYDTAMSAFGLTGFWDALAVTMGIFGQLFMNLAHWMQWVPWIIEDFAMFVISIGQGNFTMAATWLIGWLNAVFGLYWWCKRVTEFERPMRTKEDLF
jgi:nicotinamide mononucleotide transporter